jgi:deoxyhypusine synthase
VITTRRSQLLAEGVRGIDPTAFDARQVITAYRGAGLQAGALARAADLFDTMLADEDCDIVLCASGSLVSAGLRETLHALLACNMVDAVVADGVLDQDVFASLGFSHYHTRPAGHTDLEGLKLEQVLDTLVDQREVTLATLAVKEVVDELAPGPYGSRELWEALARYLIAHHDSSPSLLATAYRKDIPLFSAGPAALLGGGLRLHQTELQRQGGGEAVTLNATQDVLELTELQASARRLGLVVLGDGDALALTRGALEGASAFTDRPAATPDYEVRISLPPPARGHTAPLPPATDRRQSVLGELSATLPLLVSDAYHRGGWRRRNERCLRQNLQPITPPLTRVESERKNV